MFVTKIMKNVRKRCCHLSFHGITTKLRGLISLLAIKLSEFNDTKNHKNVRMIFIEFFIFLKYISHKMSFGKKCKFAATAKLVLYSECRIIKFRVLCC